MQGCAQHKKELRAIMQKRLKTLSSKHRHDAGHIVARHVASWLEQNPPCHQAALFVSMADEISTSMLDALLLERGVVRIVPLMNLDKQLALVSLLPHHALIDFAQSTTLARALFLGASLVDIAQIDLIFVPGLAFDRAGHRLGRGQGHYDRALSQLERTREKPLLVGLAMDEQITAVVPTEEHDIIMNYLCTPALGMVKAKDD